MFALALYYFLNSRFKPDKRRMQPLQSSSRAAVRTFSTWQAARVLLLVWAVPDSVATVSGEWPNFEIIFDDRLL